MARIDPISLPKVLFSLLLLIPILFLSTTTFAATFTVLNTDDSGAGSLRQAIIDANDEVTNPGPDDIVFADGVTGTITILNANGEMAITSDITITGPPLDIDDMPQVIIDADMNSRIFNIDNPAESVTVSISRLELTNGLATGSPPDNFGGAILNNESLSIDSSVFHRNNADTQGGAILNGGIITEITNSTFSENRAGTSGSTGGGGAILNFGGTIIEITNTTFSFNLADSGGAILNTGAIMEITKSLFDQNMVVENGGAIRNDGTISDINNSTFSFNRAEDNSSSSADDSLGGAIYNGLIITSITKSTFTSNSAGVFFISGNDGNGGAIYNEGTVDEISYSTFDMNRGNGGSGGAIYNDLGTITTIKKSTFDQNSAESGGAIINNNSIITDISHSIFNLNFAVSADGGAIFNAFGTITKITHSMFTTNTANQSGGAIFNLDGSTIMEISYSTFNGNNGPSSGGAIHNEGTINTITKSAFEMNMASTGGAILNQGDMGDLNPGTIDEISHSAFTGNIAGTFGGAINNVNAMITAMTNCTLSGNIAQAGGAIANLDPFATMQISFSTIANNTATNVPPLPIPQFGGGILNGPGIMRIINSIVGDNINTATVPNPPGTPDNCFIEMGGTFAPLGGNIDTDGSCSGFFLSVTSAVLALDMAGPQDNGGPTQTIALCTGVGTPAGCAGASIAIDRASLDCEALNDMGIPSGMRLATDQRGFPRPPADSNPTVPTCDSGAFEAQPTGSVTVQKITDPMGGEGFKFQCKDGDDLKLKSFKLDDMETDICIFPVGMASIDEDVPMGYVLDIMCTDDDTPIVTDNTGVTLDVGEGEQISCTFTNTEGRMLTVEIDPLGTGTGRVESDDGGIDCGSTANDCEETYDDGTEVDLEATNGPDSFFVGWSGDGACTGTDPMITLTMDQNINCTATFNRNPVTISVDKDGNGDGLISSDPAGINCPAGTCTSDSAMFPFGSPVILTATADDNSVFTGWLGTGSCTGNSATITVDADMDINCTAQFVLIQFPLNVTLSGNPDGDSEVRSADGNISCGTQCTFDYDIGTDVVLEADPSDDFRFVSWNPECGDTNPITTVRIDGITTCDAEFALKQFNVIVEIDPAGTGGGTVTYPDGEVCEPDCSVGFDIGSDIALTATPDGDSLPATWNTECDNGMITDLTQDTTCTATFNSTTATITADKMGDGDGLITSDPAGINCPADTCTSDSADFDFGINVDLTAAPDGDSVFVEWTGSGDCPSATPTTTVLADTAKTCTAKFDLQQFDVSVAIIGQGEVTYTPGGAVCPGDCIETFNIGTTVTLTPTADPGWQFVEWNGPADCEDGIIQNLTTDIGCTTIFNQLVSPTAQANISLNKTVSPSTVEVGEEVTFMFNVTNSGPNTAPGVNVTDPLPSSLEFVSGTGCSENGGTVTCNLGSIANGGSETVSITVIPTESGVITNTATANSGVQDPNTSNNSSSATIDVSDVPVEDEDLIVEAETQEITAEPGSTISIPVNINNPDTPQTSIFLDTKQTVTGAIFTVEIPEGFDIEQLQSTKGVCDIELGECEIGEIIPGETVIVVVDAIASDMEGVFNISFMVTTDTGQTFSGNAIVRVEGEQVNVEVSDGGGCAVAGPNTKTTSLLGLLLYALIPAVVVARRRYKNMKLS